MRFSEYTEPDSVQSTKPYVLGRVGVIRRPVPCMSSVPFLLNDVAICLSKPASLMSLNGSSKQLCGSLFLKREYQS